ESRSAGARAPSPTRQFRCRPRRCHKNPSSAYPPSSAHPPGRLFERETDVANLSNVPTLVKPRDPGPRERRRVRGSWHACPPAWNSVPGREDAVGIEALLRIRETPPIRIVVAAPVGRLHGRRADRVERATARDGLVVEAPVLLDDRGCPLRCAGEHVRE